MNRWMDILDGWINIWMEGYIGWKDILDGWMDGWIYWMDEYEMDGWMNLKIVEGDGGVGRDFLKLFGSIIGSVVDGVGLDVAGCHVLGTGPR